MSPEDTAWLAGILEGEGSFIIETRTLKKPNDDGSVQSSYSFSIKVEMTDEDVIDRVYNCVGRRGNVYFVNARKGTDNLPTVLWKTSKRELVKELITKLIPHMGSRRAGKMRNMLYLMGKYPKAPTGSAKKRALPKGDPHKSS